MSKKIITESSIFTRYTEQERQQELGVNYRETMQPPKYIDFEVIKISKIYCTVKYYIQNDLRYSKITKSELQEFIGNQKIELKKYKNIIRKIVYYWRHIENI